MGISGPSHEFICELVTLFVEKESGHKMPRYEPKELEEENPRPIGYEPYQKRRQCRYCGKPYYTPPLGP